jgi:signal transduction histidine kinase
LVYETVLDNNGFLWVATDNGISRFDGKRFINYSTKNGLPSNDVIQVFKQNDGTVWANCYKQPPSYFDEKLNRFVCLENDKFVLEISNSLLYDFYHIHKNDLFFHNYVGHFIFSKGKIENKEKYNDKEKTGQFPKLFIKNQLLTIKIRDTIFANEKFIFIKFYQNSNSLGTIKIKNTKAIVHTYFTNDSNYIFTNNTITQIKIEKLKPFQFKTITKNVPENIKWFRFSDSKLSITCTDGKVLIYDEKTLKLLSTIKSNFNVNTAYVDHQNNVWVSTLNNGLRYYTTQNIKKEHFSKDLVSNFLCANVDDKGKLFAGNYQGEIYVKKNKNETKYNFSQLKETNLWIRNIHFFPKNTIVVSDKGILINFAKKIVFHNDLNQMLNVKSSAKLNENQLILGSIQGLIVFNVKTENYKIIKFNKERILNIKRIDDTNFYFSANEGLFKYDLSANKYSLEISNHLFKNDKIEYFEMTGNSKIWISTYKGNLFLIEKSKIVKEFVNDKRIPNNISKLLNIDHQLWIASKSGIYILNYANLKDVSISKLTTSDGLTSNVVNFLNFKKDTVYAATDNGISKIPFRNINTNGEVKPQLIAVKINGKTVVLNSKYRLKSNQNNISLELAGVDITGHFKNFQYAINDENFTDIDGNFLNLQLNSGENKIIIKAINENNKIQKKAINLVFNIETPFYKTILFWIFTTLFFSALIFYFLNRQKFIVQKRKFNQEIELQKQRQKITSDLHDDLGASLSSLQINSAIAQKLLEKNPSEAKKILKKIEFQAKNISENIGDIIWSLKPTKNEFMSLSTRIKKITSEILGSSEIDYKIEIEKSIDEKITDFSARKNIILIIKECLNNILKHSNANKANLKISKIGNDYLIEISDTGIGFIGCEKKGNGLGNIKKRALELGATLEIKSDNGTTIKLLLPTFRDV